MELLFSALAFLGLVGLFSVASIAEVLFSLHGRQLLFNGTDWGSAVEFVKEHPIRVGFTIQLIRLFSAVGAAVSGAYWWVIATNTLPSQISTVDAIVSVSFVMALIMVFADLLPKIVATKFSTGLIPPVARLIYSLAWVVNPLYWISNQLIAITCKWAGVSPLVTRPWMTEDEIRQLVNHAQKEGIIDSAEQEMIQSIFQFSETVVREIMTPRADAVISDITKTVDDIIGVIRDSGHSRIPIYSGAPDSIVGFAYAKDLLCNAMVDRSLPIGPFLRPAVFIPETQSIEMVLKELKKGKTHLAIVVDEFGVPSGLVTLEDVIEEIVGEIQDEYDPVVRSDLFEVEPGVFSVAGSYNVSDFAEEMGIDLAESDDYDTMGGMVLHHVGSLPKSGDTVEIQGFLFNIEEVNERRIRRIEFRKGMS